MKNFTMDTKINKWLLWMISAIPILFLQGCILGGSVNRTADWEPPTTSHSLSTSRSKLAQVLWEDSIYVTSGALQRVQCVASEDMLVLVGSQDPKKKAQILAFEGYTGNLIWSFDSSGILTNSDFGIFIGDGEVIYLVDPKSGKIIWQKQLRGARNITAMMYYEKLLFVNSTGTNIFYVIGNDGGIKASYTQVSDFRSNHSDVPFYPTQPFGYAIDNDVLVKQRGNIGYSGYIFDKFSNQPLWQVEDDSISNFITFNDYILWISENDQIEIADKWTGKLIDDIKILPSIAFQTPDIIRQNAGYFLCGDSQAGIVYVVLGDSRQIFAVKLQK